MALVLCVALLASISPARALDVYAVQPDTMPMMLSASAYDVATTSVTNTELDVTLQKFLIYDSTSAAEFLSRIYNYLATVRNAMVVPSTSNTPFWVYGMYLSQSGEVTSPTAYMSFANVIRQGFVGVAVNLSTIQDYLSSIDTHIQGNSNAAALSTILEAVQSVDTSVISVLSAVNTVNSSVADVETAVDWVYSRLGDVQTAVGDVETAVWDVETAVDSVEIAVGTLGTTMTDLIVGDSSPFKLEAATYLSYTGFEYADSYPVKLDYLLNQGLRGLGSLLRVNAGNYHLDRYGDVVVSTSAQSISGLMRQGFMGLASQQRVPADTLLLDRTGSVVTSTTTTNMASLMRQGLMGLASQQREAAGYIRLDSTGQVTAAEQALTVTSIIRQGLLGLASQQREFAGYVRLDRTGQETVSDEALTITSIMRQGLLGIRSLVSGSETDNVYSGSLIDNENKSSTFDATGLGPMLNKYLGEIQNDTGILTYIFASPLDLEMKKNSEGNMESVNDTFLSSDSTSGVKADNISDLGDASDSIQALGQTGVSPSQAFEQISADSSSIFSLFTAEAAADLDPAASAAVYLLEAPPEIVTNYYEESRLEFYEIIEGE